VQIRISSKSVRLPSQENVPGVLDSTEKERKFSLTQQKMTQLLEREVEKIIDKFAVAYGRWTTCVMEARTRLKCKCSDSDLEDMMDKIGRLESVVGEVYLQLRDKVTPSQETRRNMNTCKIVTSILLKLMGLCLKKDERSNAEEHRLRVLVDCVYAGSKDRPTVSRVNYHSKTRRAEAAAELAANKVAMKYQAAIDTQRQLIRDLERKRDRKVNTGAYQKLYATKTDLEPSIVGNATLCKNSRVTGPHHQAPVTPLACPKVFKADNQSPDILKRSAQEDRKFQKVQFLPALIRAPDDCHSMDSLVALKREVDPNKILGSFTLNVSSKRISSSLNPFNQLSLTSSGQLNKPLVNNPWRCENKKKFCNLIHEPSLKNSAIHSQTSSELPKGKFGYQKDMNTSNSNPGTLNVWKPLESTEPVKETETTSMNDDALSNATKVIRNKVKDASSEQNHLHDQRRLVKNLFDQESSIKERDRIYPEKERSKISKRTTEKLSSVIPKRHKDKESATPKENTSISADISNTTTLNPFILHPREDNYPENDVSSSDEDSTKSKSPNNKTSVWSEEESSGKLSEPAARPISKSHKRTSKVKRRSQMDDAKTSVIPERRGRLQQLNSLRALKLAKRRGRPPSPRPLKAEILKKVVKSLGFHNKNKLGFSLFKFPRRHGRPPENISKPEFCKESNRSTKGRN